MEITFDNGAARLDLSLTVTDPEARVADLAVALGTDPRALLIDGRAIAGTLPLRDSGIVAGSTVTPPTASAQASRSHPANPAGARHPHQALSPIAAPCELRVVGGLDAGLRAPLPPGDTPIGRDASGAPGTLAINLPPVSRTHCLLTVTPDGRTTVRDLGSRNGTDVDGHGLAAPAQVGPEDTIGLGRGVLLRVVPAADRRLRHVPVDTVHGTLHGWRVPFHRQPREPLPPAVPLAVPAVPEDRERARSPFLITSLLVPIGFAALMVATTGNPVFALFALISPIGAMAMAGETRMRHRGSRRRSRQAFATDMAAFAGALAGTLRAETTRRREAGIDPAEAAFRAEAPSARLWERRTDAPDFLQVGVAVGDEPWQPELAGSDDVSRMPAEAVAELGRRRELRRVPVLVDLAADRALGVTGDRKAALAAARAVLCQLAVTTGPADLAIALFADTGSAPSWDWAKWLPHLFDRLQGTTRMVAVGRAAADTLATDLLHRHPFADGAGTLFVIVDGPALLEGRDCPLRALITASPDRTKAVVVGDRLPAACDVVLDVRGDGSGRLRHAVRGDRRGAMLVTGVSTERARETARALARFEDPEIAFAGAGLPEQAPLLPLLDLGEFTPETLLTRWAASAKATRARSVIGVTDSGRCEIDLDHDGPHALIAGSTGSGKSELLRSLVAGLAIGSDPDHLVFVLVDYKGGGALDECARLPHVVGLVTDLDEQLSRRALHCLEAELKRRERQLRGAALDRFDAYQRLRDTTRPDLEPMPRLVVVVDEFATLAKALPRFIDALVDVAQRGRSLGVHLIIATQRPAGSVSDAIKANVKLRIALRLETAEDSRDVVDSAAAATIGPRQWGRAFRRVAGGQVEAVQTAYASAVTATGEGARRVSLAPFTLEPAQEAQRSAMPADGTTDLVRLVDLARAAFELSGRPQPRSPWPEPLPERIDLASVPAQALTGMRSAADGLPAFLLADVPDDQTQPPVGWDPGLGNLLVFGGARSGKTTALASAVAAWTRTHPPKELEVHLLDFGADGLAPLAALPHVAGHVRSADRESLIRLAKLLKEELRQRKDTGVAVPRVIVAVDGLGSLLANQYTDAGLEDVITDLESVYAEGAAVGIHFVASVDRPAALPGAWHERTAQKLILALADIDDYGRFGIRNQQVPAPQPGRGVIGESAREVQVACLGGDPGQAASTIAAIAAAWPGAPRVRRIRTLPEVARLAELPIIARTEEHPWSVPIGVEQASLEPSALLVREHGHVLLAGPPLSGRSTLLCTIAMGIAASGEIPVFAYAPRSSPVRRLPAPVRVAATLAELTEFVTAGEHERAPVVVVDDADVLNSGEDLFAALTGHEDPGIHVIAVSRNEATSNMPYWLSAIRRCKTGVLLMPGRFDGDLFGDVTLPARPALGPRTGRGYLVQDGRITSVQAAVPDLPEPA